MATEFRLLGSIEAYVDGRPVAIGYAQLRSVLAVLLVEANRVVPVDQLVDHVWGTRRRPRRPRSGIQHSITLLRTALAPIPHTTIAWQANGYRLTADPATIDLHEFHRLTDAARAAADDPTAATLFERALGLWHGEPCAGVDTPWFNNLRSALDHQRLAAQRDLTDVRLRRGEHAALLPDLTDWTKRHPLDERLAGQLMLALCRDGKPVRALEHYERVRRHLADELGTDPSPALRELHRRIRTADPTLAATAPAAPIPSPTPLVPRQLPAVPRRFTGRTPELSALDAAGPGGTVVITAIGGIGGIGKSWLALYWAHRHLDRFPDGQLHVNLRGFDPTGEPVPPGTAVRGFLTALGVPPAAIPDDLDARSGLYRSMVVGRRILIVLDNARDTTQVLPLLPGSSTCTVLITSRHRLTGLVTTHGARQLDLDVLSEGEARDLLSRHLGADRLNAEPDAVAQLLDRCAGLPLAIGIVAARAATHPEFPLSVVADDLRDHAGRLDALDIGELTGNVRSVLSWSHAALSAGAADLFGLLGLVPGPDINTAAVASLTALPIARVRTLLRELENGSLVRQHEPGRYRMHDLVRLYAAERARQDERAGRCGGPGGHTAALQRLVGYYVDTAFGAERLLEPLMPPIRADPPATGHHVHHLADLPTAVAWFTAEYPNLVAAQDLAAERGWATSVWWIARTLTTFFYRQGRFQAALSAWQAGEAAADRLDDPAIRARTHQFLGAILAELGRFDEALHHLALAEQGGDLPDQAYTRHAIGRLWSLRGDMARALPPAEDALRRYRELGMVAGQSRELTALAWYRALLGEFAPAKERADVALAFAREHHCVEDEALVLAILGYIAFNTGRYADAIGHLEPARDLLDGFGHIYYEAGVLEYLGRTRLALGDPDAARTAWERALVLFRSQGHDQDADRITALIDDR